jgi:hypothetical protein
MATIDIKLTQATENQLHAMATGTSSIDATALLEQLGDSLAPLAMLDDDSVLTWRQEADASFKLFLAGGATLTFTGATFPFLGADSRFYASATGIAYQQPGAVSVTQAGDYQFVFTATGGDRLVVNSVTALTTSGAVSTQYDPASPLYDADIGNLRLAFDGLLRADAAGTVTGQVRGITLQADAFLRSATLAGTFDVAAIAEGTGGGVLTDAAIEFHDGAHVRVAGAAITVDGETDFDASLLANPAALSGDDTIRVELPDTLHDSVAVASGAGNDTVTIAGGGGRLHVHAGTGNDVVNVLSGSHFLEGGSGVDTVVYAGKRGDYGLTVTAEALFTTTAASGARDTLTNVERIEYADGALAFDTEGSAGQAYRLYLSAFDRAPDQAGLGFWISALDGGATLLDASREFIASEEFATLYGGQVDNGKFVELLYQNVLHRAADKAGYDYWAGALESGDTDRAHMLVDFSNSTEHRDDVSASIASGIAYLPY